MLFLSLRSFKKNCLKVDGIELRLDAFQHYRRSEISAFCSNSGLPVLFTLRKRSHGGEFSGTEQQRLEEIEALLALGPDFMDLESDTDPLFVKKVAASYPKTKIILSCHDFSASPKDLQGLLASMHHSNAYAYKIATMASSPLDAIRMLSFVKKNRSYRVSGLCMGLEGQLTRLLAPVVGSFANYAPETEEEKTAPGQISVDELFSKYQYAALNTSSTIKVHIGSSQSDDALFKVKLKSAEVDEFISLSQSCEFICRIEKTSQDNQIANFSWF